MPAAGEVAAAGEVNALNAEATLETSFEPELEGKHRSITHCFKLRTIIICYVCAFKFQGVDWNHSCISLSSLCLNTRMTGPIVAMLRLRYKPSELSLARYRSCMFSYVGIMRK